MASLDKNQIARLSELIADFLKENGYSSLDLTPGTPIFELFVRGLAISLESIAENILDLESKLFLTDVDKLTIDDLKNLASMFLVDITEASKATAVVRIYYTTPQEVDISTNVRFFTSDGLGYYPSQSYKFDPSNFHAPDTEVNMPYVEITVVAEAEGDQYNVPENSILFAEGLEYDYIRNPYPVIGGASSESFDSLKQKILNSLSIRSLTTKSSIEYEIFSVSEWIPDRIEIIGQKDKELVRDVVDNIKTGHAVDIYYYKENADLVTYNFVYDSSAFIYDDSWWIGRYYVEITSNDITSDNTQLGTFKILSLSESFGGNFDPVVDSRIGSVYGTGIYGKGPYGTTTTTEYYIKKIDPVYHKSYKDGYRIYLPLLLPNSIQITVQQNRTINSIQANFDSKVIIASFLVKEFLEARPYLAINIIDNGENINTDELRSLLIEEIKKMLPSEGLDRSRIVSIIENKYPKSYVTDVTMSLHYELPDAKFRIISDDSFISIPESELYSTTSRLYVFVFPDPSNQIVLNISTSTAS